MTGMDVAKKLGFREEVMEAVFRTQPLDIPVKPENYEKAIEILEPFAREDNGLRIMHFYLDWAVDVKEQYDALGIPDKVFWDSMKDLAIWAEDYQEKHGVPGFGEWGWVAATMTMWVFRLGRLQFQSDRLEEDLICGDRTYPAGTAILNVHIPAGDPLDVEAVREAMDYAPRFYETHFGKTFTLFHCHSWLLSPQLKEILPEDSRILQFQNLFEVCWVDQERQAEERVFGSLAEDPATYPEETSLQRKMKAALLEGKHFGMGCGIRVITSAVC